jgi:hypothetical protein
MAYRMMPQLHTSAFLASYLELTKMTSGAMYTGVPSRVLAVLLRSCLE